MLTTVLVPLDGSRFAERALPYAAALTRASGGTLILFHASTSRGTDPAADPKASAAEALAGLADRLRADGVSVETQVVEVYFADVVEAIRQAALAGEAELIVMSTHGRGGLGRWLYGSVADQLLRESETPVMLVPAEGLTEWPEDGKRTVLVPLDGSELAAEALGPAAELAEALGADLLLLQVVAPPNYGLYAEPAVYLPFDPEEDMEAAERYLEEAAKPLRAAGKSVSVHAEIGQPGWNIAEVARARGVAAIAMATHGRSGLTRLVMGSVATATLQKTGVPLLLIRPALEPQPAVETPAGAPATSEKPAALTTMLEVSMNDLQMIERGLGEMLFRPGGDWHVAGSAHELLERVRTAQRALLEASGEPAGSPR